MSRKRSRTKRWSTRYPDAVFGREGLNVPARRTEPIRSVLLIASGVCQPTLVSLSTTRRSQSVPGWLRSSSPFRELSDDFPLHQRHVLVGMILEDRLHLAADHHVLHRVTQEVPNHPDVAGIGKLDQDHQIRPGAGQGGVNGMPGSFPAVDPAATGDLGPADIERMAMVANPFRAPLEALTRMTALYHQLVTFGGLPEFGIQPVGS